MIAESHSLTGVVAPTHDVSTSPNAVSGAVGARYFASGCGCH